MPMRPTVLLVLALPLLAAACTKAEPEAEAQAFVIPEGLVAGSNEMLKAPVEAAPNLEVVISDVIIPPNSQVPGHYHPGEEFAYVIEGSAVHVEQGKPERPVGAGEAFVIPPNAVHAPRGGPDGARAIVFRVHVKDRPERIPAEL
jgi:quercetin dioxygenase-like cupin family protein